jgi:hypothetical protein
MEWGANEWVAAASALLALASLVLNALVVRRQTQLQFESLKAQMDTEVLAWAHEAISLVSQAEALARGRGAAYGLEEFRRLASDVAHRLSAIADQGRLFFPNRAPEEHGQDKEGAFQGRRQPILDAVVFSCVQLDRLAADVAGPDEQAAQFLNRCRRLLVSEAQNAVDPRRRSQMLRRLAVGRMDDKKSALDLSVELAAALR